jgi:hypothetical protein
MNSSGRTPEQRRRTLICANGALMEKEFLQKFKKNLMRKRKNQNLKKNNQ